MADGVEIARLYARVMPNLDGFYEETKIKLAAWGKALAVKVPLDVDTKRADESMAEWKARTKAASRASGTETGGAFGSGMRAALNAAMRAMPKLDVDADITEADLKLAELRKTMQELRDAHIGVDLDDGQALAQIYALRAQLRGLSEQTNKIDLRTNLGGATDSLEKFLAGISKGLGNVGDEADNASHSMSGMSHSGVMAAANMAMMAAPLAIIGAALEALPWLVGAASIAIAGLGAAIAGTAAAATGLGALVVSMVPGISRIVTAWQAESQAQAQASSAASRAATARDQLRTAQENLNKAVVQARQDLKDLDDQLTDASLGQKRAAITLRQAQEQYAKDRLTTGNTGTDLDSDRLAIQEARQRLKESGEQVDELRAKKAQADKAGVMGSDTVVQAQRQVAAAHRAVGEAGGDAAKKAKDALADLTPQERETYNLVRKISTSFSSWGRSMETYVSPIVNGVLKAVPGLLKGLTPLVKQAALGLGDAMKDAGLASKDPVFGDAFKNLEKTIRPAVRLIGDLLIDLGKGLAGIFNAFAGNPNSKKFGDQLRDAGDGFAKWGEGLGKTKGFKDLMEYLVQNGPKLGQTIKNIAADLVELFKNMSAKGSDWDSIVSGSADLLGTIDKIYKANDAFKKFMTTTGASGGSGKIGSGGIAKLMGLDKAPEMFSGLGKNISKMWKSLRRPNTNPVRKSLSSLGNWIGKWAGKSGDWFGGMWKSLRSPNTNPVRRGLRAFGGWVKDWGSSAGDWLKDSGKKLIQGFVDGIKSMGDKAKSAVKGIMAKIARFFPHSPAPEGPFSGHGWTLHSGRAIGQGLAQGMADTTALVRSAAAGMTGAASPSGGVSLSLAGGSRGRSGPLVGSLTVNNPIAEPASRSVVSGLRDAGFALSLG